MIFDGLKTLIGDCDSYLKKGAQLFWDTVYTHSGP